jgi:beta-galactosidase
VIGCFVLAFGCLPAAAEDPVTYELRDVPADYELQAYDDCGVADRQPHVVESEGVHEYSPASVNADERARTVAWGWREVRARYDDLDPGLDYALAITYANEPFNHRVQSLWAGGLRLHEPLELPKGGVRRIVLSVPREAIPAGRLELTFRLEAQVNVVVSEIELWAPRPSPTVLHLSPVWALYGDLHGEVTDLRFDPLVGASVVLRVAGSEAPLAETQTSADGSFRFPREALSSVDTQADLEVVAEHAGLSAARAIPAEERRFEPVRYRPIPTRQAGLASGVVLLDGEWRIHPKPNKRARQRPLDRPGWKPYCVPGQWLQQGYDLPQDQAVAVAREFAIPRGWQGRRLFLRFDGVHAGTRYWLNGQHLGYSENLFTPVEWEVTEAARVGATNRLDLEMTVDTLSEQLSHSCGYAFHNLGGIDRSVRLFALPQLSIRDLRLDAGLDETYRDGVLDLSLTLDGAAPDLALRLALLGPDGDPVEHSVPLAKIGPDQAAFHVRSIVPEVLAWTAETPRLYMLRLDLLRKGRLVERVERRMGFRRIEVRGSQLYVNGKRVKLAGACHHEIDPLTGRANTACHAETDVRLLKQANLNYIRTSHYPPTGELLDAADRIGMYVEVEAPFCWVGNDSDPSHLRAVLTPTSAMIDTCRAHPSVLLWSLANESQFNPLFEVSAQLCKDLDPTRPTTFNNPDPKRLCDIANLHYPAMPYGQHLPGDPRPVFLGEYFFPVCHEQTDVRIDPGLRELWGAGHSAPDSDWGRKCAESFSGYFGPGTPPGAWSSIVRSDRVIGGAIWAALDDAFYLPDGRNVGYAWHHGFWGLIDAWRRPKPEWWLAKMIFSPVWFPARQLDWRPGMTRVEIPVENRYSFTDLRELRFAWALGDHHGTCRVNAAPGETGTLSVLLPPDTDEGSTLTVDVRGADRELITVATISLGEQRPQPLPRPKAGPPSVAREGEKAIITGDGFALVFDTRSGAFDPSDPRHTAAVTAFPSVHFTRFDFGDLAGPNALPYAVLPDESTRVVEGAVARETDGGVEMKVAERFDGVAGSTTWLLDSRGVGTLTYDYAYTGQPISVREIGVRLLLEPACDEIVWKRWSEWGVYPEDSISRTEGRAKARRTPRYDPSEERIRPAWPWALDQTDLGTNDFRAVKLNVLEAALLSARGEGLRVHANADAHVRACLDPAGVKLHLLSECRLGPISLKPGDRLRGRFAVELLSR